MNRSLALFAAAALGLGMTGAASAQVQGVTDTEVVIGAHTDMSGIFAAFGAPSIKAANLYLDEVNAKGGIHGRKIKYIVEDHAYQMPKANQAINKLINSDKVFAMVLSLGTPMNMAAFKLQDPKKIPNVVPLSAARQMLDPPVDYKFTPFSSYYDQIKAGIKYLSQKDGSKSVCAMYIPSDFGLEIKQGAEDQAKAQSLKYAAETTHKPDDADFVGSLTKLKDANCEIVAIALGVRQIITAVATAKKIGWTNVKFLGSSAGFHTAIAQAPGNVTDGLYAVAGWADIVARIDSTPALKDWVEKYKAATGEFPGTGALLGRTGMETFIRGLEAAGKDLTPESFKKAMEGLKYDDPISSNKLAFSAANHQGSKTNIISVVKGGVWTEIARQDQE